MITRNFKRLQKDILQRGGNFFQAYELKDATNTKVYAAQEAPDLPLHPSKVSTSTDEDGIIIGSSNTAESETDYWLGNQITSGFSSVVVPHHKKDTSGNHILLFYVTITNTEESDLVIKEIGYACLTTVVVPHSPSWIAVDYKATKNILLDRTVLETPVTITAGNSATIGYSLKTYEVEIPSASGVSF